MCLLTDAALDIIPPPPLTEDSVYQPFSGSILCDKKNSEEQGTTVSLHEIYHYIIMHHVIRKFYQFPLPGDTCEVQVKCKVARYTIPNLCVSACYMHGLE